jgi:SWI/SNF-related matrix-associated actin-dependent regulator of chromatin subfamily B protein 1
MCVNGQVLVDQFEWDINSPINSPEDFAHSMAADLVVKKWEVL